MNEVNSNSRENNEVREIVSECVSECERERERENENSSSLNQPRIKPACISAPKDKE